MTHCGHRRVPPTSRRSAVAIVATAAFLRMSGVDPKGDISQGGDLARGDAGISVRPRSQQLRRVPHDRLPSMLEYRERLGDFGNRLFRALRIDDDNVSRVADGKAIVGKIEQLR